MNKLGETKEKEFKALKEDLGLKNIMQTPRVEKIVISTGVGSVTDKKRMALIQERLAKITGQKPSPRAAKKSIAGFKSREGNTIGFQITLRGKRMTDFLNRFINISLPRTRDFRGISRDSVDPMGNLTIGVKEHTIFPETSEEDLKDIFGLSVTIVTSSTNKREATKFLEHLGVPFKK